MPLTLDRGSWVQSAQVEPQTSTSAQATVQQVSQAGSGRRTNMSEPQFESVKHKLQTEGLQLNKNGTLGTSEGSQDKDASPTA